MRSSTSSKASEIGRKRLALGRALLSSIAISSISVGATCISYCACPLLVCSTRADDETNERPINEADYISISFFFLSRIESLDDLLIIHYLSGSAFRSRLRMYPSLVNCCTIDWFSEWPSDALYSVARHFLSDVEMNSDETRVAVLDMCMKFQVQVRELVHSFFQEMKRPMYVTPTSYLELITTYKTLLAKKRAQVKSKKLKPLLID